MYRIYELVNHNLIYTDDSMGGYMIYITTRLPYKRLWFIHL